MNRSKSSFVIVSYITLSFLFSLFLPIIAIPKNSNLTHPQGNLFNSPVYDPKTSSPTLPSPYGSMDYSYQQGEPYPISMKYNFFSQRSSMVEILEGSYTMSNNLLLNSVDNNYATLIPSQGKSRVNIEWDTVSVGAWQKKQSLGGRIVGFMRDGGVASDVGINYDRQANDPMDWERGDELWTRDDDVPNLNEYTMTGYGKYSTITETYVDPYYEFEVDDYFLDDTKQLDNWIVSSGYDPDNTGLDQYIAGWTFEALLRVHLRYKMPTDAPYDINTLRISIPTYCQNDLRPSPMRTRIIVDNMGSAVPIEIVNDFNIGSVNNFNTAITAAPTDLIQDKHIGLLNMRLDTNWNDIILIFKQKDIDPNIRQWDEIGANFGNFIFDIECSTGWQFDGEIKLDMGFNPKTITTPAYTDAKLNFIGGGIEFDWIGATLAYTIDWIYPSKSVFMTLISDTSIILGINGDEALQKLKDLTFPDGTFHFRIYAGAATFFPITGLLEQLQVELELELSYRTLTYYHYKYAIPNDILWSITTSLPPMTQVYTDQTFTINPNDIELTLPHSYELIGVYTPQGTLVSGFSYPSNPFLSSNKLTKSSITAGNYIVYCKTKNALLDVNSYQDGKPKLIDMPIYDVNYGVVINYTKNSSLTHVYTDPNTSQIGAASFYTKLNNVAENIVGAYELTSKGAKCKVSKATAVISHYGVWNDMISVEGVFLSDVDHPRYVGYIKQYNLFTLRSVECEVGTVESTETEIKFLNNKVHGFTGGKVAFSFLEQSSTEYLDTDQSFTVNQNILSTLDLKTITVNGMSIDLSSDLSLTKKITFQFENTGVSPITFDLNTSIIPFVDIGGKRLGFDLTESITIPATTTTNIEILCPLRNAELPKHLGIFKLKINVTIGATDALFTLEQSPYLILCSMTGTIRFQEIKTLTSNNEETFDLTFLKTYPNANRLYINYIDSNYLTLFSEENQRSALQNQPYIEALTKPNAEQSRSLTVTQIAALITDDDNDINSGELSYEFLLLEDYWGGVLDSDADGYYEQDWEAMSYFGNNEWGILYDDEIVQAQILNQYYQMIPSSIEYKVTFRIRDDQNNYDIMTFTFSFNPYVEIPQISNENWDFEQYNPEGLWITKTFANYTIDNEGVDANSFTFGRLNIHGSRLYVPQKFIINLPAAFAQAYDYRIVEQYDYQSNYVTRKKSSTMEINPTEILPNKLTVEFEKYSPITVIEFKYPTPTMIASQSEVTRREGMDVISLTATFTSDDSYYNITGHIATTLYAPDYNWTLLSKLGADYEYVSLVNYSVVFSNDPANPEILITIPSIQDGETFIFKFEATKITSESGGILPLIYGLVAASAVAIVVGLVTASKKEKEGSFWNKLGRGYWVVLIAISVGAGVITGIITSFI